MYKENSENELGFSTLYLFEDDAFVFAAINPECDPENESIDQRRILRGFRVDLLQICLYHKSYKRRLSTGPSCPRQGHRHQALPNA